MCKYVKVLVHERRDVEVLVLESGSKLRLGFFQKNIARHVCRLSGI